jgi:hypothetical protein
MTQVATTPEFSCPSCLTTLSSLAQGDTSCPRCGWKGEVFTFSPSELQIEAAEAALPDEATCINHPSKKATTVCAGTGDYICSLCAIEVKGQTYSAQYIDTTGADNLKAAFKQTYSRPDRRINLFLISVLIPGVNYVTVPFAFLWIPYCFVLYRRAMKMRREDPLFEQLMGTSYVVIIPILLVLFAIGWLVGAVSLIYVFTTGMHHGR